MGHFYIRPEDMAQRVAQHMPTAARMEKLSLLVWAQVQERFITQGASGGVPWPPVKLPPKSGSPALKGIEKDFVHSGVADGRSGTAEVSSDFPHVFTQQFGATIVPKKAKALWIPISEKAKEAQRTGQAPVMRIEHGEFKGLMLRNPELKKGVDFIFAKKSVVPARPMLPNSPHERDVATRYMLKLLAEP